MLRYATVIFRRSTRVLVAKMDLEEGRRRRKGRVKAKVSSTFLRFPPTTNSLEQPSFSKTSIYLSYPPPSNTHCSSSSTPLRSHHALVAQPSTSSTSKLDVDSRLPSLRRGQARERVPYHRTACESGMLLLQPQELLVETLFTVYKVRQTTFDSLAPSNRSSSSSVVVLHADPLRSMPLL